MNLDRPIAPEPYSLLPRVPEFRVMSEDVATGQPMDIRYSADGANVSPHLKWDGFPEQTVAFAVSCFDPDAPTPAGFWHWTLVNLPTSVTELPRGFGDPARALPAGVVRARNDGGTLGYIGAAPPPGDRAHRYIFAVHALDAVVEVPDGIGCTPAAFMSLFHTIARGWLTPTYVR